MQGDFVKHSLIYTLMTLLNRGMAFVLLPLMTHYLSPSDYGVIDFINLSGAFVLVICGLEIHQAISRMINDYQAADKILIFSTSILFLCVSYAGFAILANCFHRQFYQYLIPLKNVLAFNLIIIIFWCQAIIYYSSVLLRFSLQPRLNALITTIIAMLTLGLNLLFVAYYRLGLNGAIYALFLASLSGMLISLMVLRPFLAFKFKLNYLSQLIKYSFPLIFSSLAAVTMVYSDRIMLKHFLSFSDVGIFGVGYRFASIISILMVGVQSAVAPLIFSSLEKADFRANLAAIFDKFMVLAIAGIGLICLFSKEILQMVVSPGYYSANLTMCNMSIAILASQLYVFTPGLQIAKKTRIILAINLLGGVLNLGFSYLGVKYWGLNGASAASLISYLLVFILYYQLSQKTIYIPYQLAKLFKNIGLIVILNSLLIFLNLSLVWKLILAFAGYAFYYAANFQLKPRAID